MRKLRIAALLAVITVGGVGCGGEDPNPAVTPDPEFGSQPNFVFVLTDDQDLASFNRRTMPHTYRLLADQGTVFGDYVDTTPICCPARAALITGQYGHNNGVLNNKPGYEDLREPDNVLPVWLQRAGYRTAYVGKFMNGYERTVGDNKTVAPGWDEWWTLVGKHSYYDFKLAVSGERRKRKYEGRYITDVLSRRAAALVGQLSGEDPFFLQLAQLAPHVENGDSGGRCGTQTVPAPRDIDRFRNAPLPHPASIAEDVSDKPSFITGLSPIGAEQVRIIERRYRCRLASLAAVDRGIARVVGALRESGELDDTVLIFTSDNGTFHGEHRIPGGKTLAYREASELPLVIRAPDRYLAPGPPTARSEAPVASIDVVPTIVEWAGAETCPEVGDCRVMDGRSLLSLLAGKARGWPDRRPLLTESDVGKDELKTGRATSCVYAGVRDGRWLYMHHASIPDLETGVCDPESQASELYDHARDPGELENLLAGSPGSRATTVESRLAKLTEELADCAGIEGRDPEPESGHYCR